MSRNYWVALFNRTTWREFVDSGGDFAVFRKTRWQCIQNISPGDYLLCYVTGISGFVAVLEVSTRPYLLEQPGVREEFPCRVKVRTIISVELDRAVLFHDLKEKLVIFANLRNPARWGVLFRTSPSKWMEKDGNVVAEALYSKGTSS